MTQAVTRAPHSSRTVRGVTLSLNQIDALRRVVLDYTRYDLSVAISDRRTADALWRRHLIEHGRGGAWIPTSRGVWMLYEIVGEDVHPEVARQFIDADRTDANRQENRRNRYR